MFEFDAESIVRSCAVNLSLFSEKKLLITIRVPRSSELMMLFARRRAKMCSTLNSHLRLAGKMSQSL